MTVPLAAACEQLRIGYPGRALGPALNLELKPGRILLVVGRNGAGKSTFVRTLLGLMPPLSGRVQTRRGLRAAYVPQRLTLASAPLRVCDIVRWGPQRGWSFLRPWSSASERALAEQSLAELGLAAFANRRLDELSGGQRQRVMLARLLASSPQLAVLDEPTASMDATSERTTFQALQTLAQARGMAAVVVSHSVAVAAPWVDDVLFFDTDDEAGPHALVGEVAEVVSSPRFVALFGQVAVGDHAAA